MERKQTRLTLLVLFTMILATACSGGTSSQKNPVNQPVAHSGIALPAYLTGLNESDISARLEVYNSIGELIHSEELEINNTSVSSGNFDLDNNGLYTFVVAFYTTSGDTEVALCYALINKTVTAKNPSISFSEEDVIYQNNSSGEFISSSINLGLYSVPNLDRDGDGVSNLFEIIEGNDPLVANQTDNNDDTDTGSDEEVDPDAVSIESFKATRTAIQSGETTTLSWKASNYNSLNITPDVGDVTDLTSIALFPSKTTTYVLLATKDEQSSSAEVTISVNHSPVFVKHLTSQALHNAAEGSLLSWCYSDSVSDSVTATIKFYDTKTCTCDNAANCFESNTTDSEYMVDGLSVLKDYSYSLSLDDGKGGSDESPCFAFTTGIDQLAAWWRFDDEGESETADVSENANTLTLAATSGDLPVYSSGIKGQAIELSGTNYLGAVDNDSLDLGTSDFTLSFFFLAPEESSDHTIFYKKGGSANAAGFEVYQSNDNDGMRSRIANGTNNIAITSSHSDLDDNNWHHVVITRQDQQYSTYIDGQLSNQYSFLESMNLDNSNNLTIGSNGSNYFQGSLDEIVLTKSAMSAAQVLALCEEGLGSTSCGAKNNQPTALSPIHGWTYQYNRVNLTWQESSDGASYYEVCWQRATTNPFADEETMTCENSASTTEPYVTLDEDQLRLPETSDTYWWHVRACSIGSDDSISCSSYSEPRSFKIQNKLQAWWRFDSKTGSDVFDLSDFNNDGFFTGDHSPLWADDLDCAYGNSCLDFDGANDYAQVYDADALDLGTGDFSLSLWVRSDYLTGEDFLHRIIISKQNEGSNAGFTIKQVYGSHKLYAEITDGIESTSLISDEGYLLNDTLWHHILLVRNGETLSFYLDGQLLASTIGETTINVSGSSHFYFGGPKEEYSGVSRWYHSGLLDDVSIHKSLITEPQLWQTICAVYNSHSESDIFAEGIADYCQQ